MKINRHLIIIFFITPIFIFSQDNLLKKANEHFENLAYTDAINLYHKIINKGNESIEVFQQLADAYYTISDLTNASKWYKKMIKQHTNLKNNNSQTKELNLEHYYRAAQCYRHLELYDEANKLVAKAKTINEKDSRAQRLEADINYLEKIKQQSGRYTITNFSANSAFTDFAPTTYLDQLVFSSSRGKGRHYSNNNNSWNKHSYLDLYTITYDDSLKVSYPKEFAKKLDSRLHEATSAFTKDGTTIYFTRNNINNKKYKKDSLGFNRLKIFKSIKAITTNKWSSPQELPFNNDKYSVAHPAISPDEKKLYFASDMPGGYGSSDIYSIDILENGKFGIPQNLGPEINTEGRDTFPFMSKTGKLYFCSDGHPGLGGFDIFVIDTKEPEKKVFNIGEPVNSTADDITFMINDDTKKGYFASNRPGGKGDDDIYSIIQTKPLKANCDGAITGTMLDKDSQKQLSNTHIVITDPNNEIIHDYITDSSGFFTKSVSCNDKEYTIVITKTGYKPINIKIAIHTEHKEFFEKIFLTKDIPEKGIDLAKLLNLQPIYFDSGKALILGETAEELNKIIVYMKKYPSLKIEVGSHTDSKGSDAFNLKLSSRRATSTVNYIISKGIDPSRIKGRGYGETLLQNKCSNGVPCTKEQHKKNRRSEFIITEN